MAMTVDLLVSFGLVLFFLGAGVLYDVFRNPIGYKAQFRIRRTYNWVIVGLAYTLQIMAKYNVYSLNTDKVREIMGLNKEQLGTALAIGNWSYAVFMLINGYLVDKHWNARGWVLLAGIGNAIANALFAFVCASRDSGGLANHIFFAALLSSYMFLNGYLQSLGSLASTKATVAWYLKEERGTFSGVFGIMLALGYQLALVGGGYIVSAHPWYHVFTVTSALSAAVLVLNFLSVRDNPPNPLKDIKPDASDREILLANTTSFSRDTFMPVGEYDTSNFNLSTPEEPRSDSHHVNMGLSPTPSEGSYQPPASVLTATPSPMVGDTKPPTAAISSDKKVATSSDRSGWGTILNSPKIWMFGSSIVCYGFVREGFFAWINSYVEYTYQISIGDTAHVVMSTMITLGTIFGSFCSGLLADMVFKDNRVALAQFFFVGLIVVFPVLALVQNWVFAVLCIFSITLSLFGLQGFRRVVGMDFPKQVSMVNGLLGCMQFIGGGFGGVVFSAEIDFLGYSFWFFTMMALTAVGSAVLTAYWFFCGRESSKSSKCKEEQLKDIERHFEPLDQEMFQAAEEPDTKEMPTITTTTTTNTITAVKKDKSAGLSSP